MNLEKVFLQETSKSLRRGERFGVAVSGGVDSMVLLCLIQKFSKSFGWCPVALHLNHKLRGQAAKRDAKLVESFSKTGGISCIIESLDVQALSKKKKISLEDAGRKARLAFFEKAAKKYHFRKILLAHHQDDLVETVLMRLFRGTGLRGLQAMQQTSLLQDLILIRPFLGIPKTIIRKYALRHRVKCHEDVTNQDDQFFRNKIRLRLIPFLKRLLGKSSLEKLLAFRMNAGIAFDFIEKNSQQLYSRLWKRGKSSFWVSRRAYLKLHPALQFETLTQAYRALIGKSLEQQEWVRIQEVLAGAVPQVNLRGNCFFTKAGDSFRLSR